MVRGKTERMNYSTPSYGEDLSAPLSKEIMPSAARWVDLESVILSILRQTEKEKYRMAALICRSKNK